MSIQKKSLIGKKTAATKAVVAKTSPSVRPTVTAAVMPKVTAATRTAVKSLVRTAVTSKIHPPN